jgi:hypothetical protein
VTGHENEDTNRTEQAESPGSTGLLRWLFRPRERRFLLPATGVWILALDWLLFASNILSAWLATPAVMVVGFMLGSAGTFIVQKRAGKDAAWVAALKAIVAGIVVGVPWAIGGTLVGGWILFSSGLADVRRQIMGK